MWKEQNKAKKDVFIFWPSYLIWSFLCCQQSGFEAGLVTNTLHCLWYLGSLVCTFWKKKLSHQDHPQHLFLECKSPVTKALKIRISLNLQSRAANLNFTYRLRGIVGIVLSNPFSWRCQNLLVWHSSYFRELCPLKRFFSEYLVGDHTWARYVCSWRISFSSPLWKITRVERRSWSESCKTISSAGEELKKVQGKKWD